jgi:hypothetical protein
MTLLWCFQIIHGVNSVMDIRPLRIGLGKSGVEGPGVKGEQQSNSGPGL